jgi:16S rRNA processing protein RimM
MNKNDCFFLGKTVRKHGLKGEVKILLDVDFPSFYNGLESVFIELNDELIPYFFEHFQVDKRGYVIAKFEDVDGDRIETLINRELVLPLTALPPLEDDQFYYHDIIGWEAIDMNNETIGIIESVRDVPGQDLFVVKHGEREILIPVIDQFIHKVHKAKSAIQFDLPEGLTEL